MSDVNNGQHTPDLQSILATLATFAPAQPNPMTPPVPEQTPANPVCETASQPKASDPRLRPQKRSTASPKPVVDPASITTWQDGLRCVTKIAAQNAQFAASIRKMIDNQRQNEMRWYAERQALKQSQSSRERASAQASEILKGLSNGSSTDAENDASAVDLDKALAVFDRKIYAAQRQMEAAMTEELKVLGVPFFGTDLSAIVDDEDTTQDVAQASLSRPKHSSLVTEKQLLDLRRRMVEHLEALYRD